MLFKDCQIIQSVTECLLHSVDNKIVGWFCVTLSARMCLIKLSELLAMYWQANNLLEHVVHKHCTITKYCIITKHIWNKVPKSHPVNWAWLKTTIPSWTLWARDIRIQWGSSLGPGPRPQSDDSTHSLVPWSDPARVWQNLVYYM